MGKRKHILIIDPAGNTAQLESFNRLTLKHTLCFSYHLPQLMGMASIVNLNDNFDAIIIFGGSCSVHDDMKWQRAFNHWLRHQIEDNVPILGICYGHQLVAHLEGATVDYVFEKDFKRKGLFDVSVLESDFTDQAKLKLIFSHNEAVVALGDNFIELGYSNERRNEFIKHKYKPIWGTQAHPESSFTFGKHTGNVENLNHSDLINGHNFLDSFIDFITKQ